MPESGRGGRQILLCSIRTTNETWGVLWNVKHRHHNLLEYKKRAFARIDKKLKLDGKLFLQQQNNYFQWSRSIV